MQLKNILFSMYLLSSCICVSADIENDLRKSIDIAMKCHYREPPKGPVIAVTPLRFTQIVVLLHERFKTPACGREPVTSISLSDERTWPFCVFGTCTQGQCHCAYHYTGRKCSISTKKCWLMYCFLTSCHPVHQSLHCICDPSLYGKKITSGIYWYDEGQSSEFHPPPPGWQDELAGEKISQGYPAIHKSQALQGSELKSQHNKMVSQQDLQTGQRRRPSHQKAVASVPGFGSGVRVKSFGARNKNRANVVGNNFNNNDRGSVVEDDTAGNSDKHADKQVQKTDIDEALQELDELSVAAKIGSNRFGILIFISFVVHYLHEIYLI